MKHALAFFSLPAAVVLVGLAMLILTPDVTMTYTKVEVVSSHTTWFMLVMFGFLFGALAAMFWDTTK
jgi:hypothetical protein